MASAQHPTQTEGLPGTWLCMEPSVSFHRAASAGHGDPPDGVNGVTGLLKKGYKCASFGVHSGLRNNTVGETSEFKNTDSDSWVTLRSPHAEPQG